jgi:hypothetical protein
MDLLIVSGLSGAGKSVAMNALEDIGFFCIDNIPAALLPSITAFSKAGDNQLKRVALCMDIRGCRTPEEIEEALSQLDAQGIEYEILFLDAPDDVLMRRYSETRRRHPMSISDGLSTRDDGAGDFDAQNVIILAFQAGALIVFGGVPCFQLDDEVEAFTHLDRAHTEHTGHIDDADTAQLNEVADVFRRSTHDLTVGDLAQLHGIVGNEAVAALDQLDGQLALADAAVAENEDAFTVNFHQPLRGLSVSLLRIFCRWPPACFSRALPMMSMPNRNRARPPSREKTLNRVMFYSSLVEACVCTSTAAVEDPCRSMSQLFTRPALDFTGPIPDYEYTSGM